MIKAFQLLYQNRQSVSSIKTEEELRAIIHSELLDEYTHPRARLSIQKKYSMALERIENSKLSNKQQQAMVELYKEELIKLSTEDNS
ncbi:hypothetical protein MPH47_16565 [Psychrobacillus psychrodurans]|jgi:hypothetical protein|uniref:hypothetical protein n=1 Tax=Psychrobacillus TaxID=1221880 RepID=UPI0008EC7F59|nr:hypothetical protein [Psychrobacillus psychrodurans]MCK1998813.1 hypothetical protein [Psychrobacillus psychrodurans]MCZ8539932.1 hypothetical protein [Psychrobacillus psychrodurans]SFM53980.1 hypothetical protein SAMN05421832_103286 [Psychrobacillus psychrodurans]